PTPPAPESHRPSAGGSWVSLLAGRARRIGAERTARASARGAPQPEGAGRALHLLLHEALRVLERGVDGGGGEILEQLAIALREELRVDLDREHAQLAAHGRGHEAGLRAALHGAPREFALELGEPALHLLRAPHPGAEIRAAAHRGPPAPGGRISTTSPPRISRAAFTAGWSRAARRRRRAASSSASERGARAPSAVRGRGG